MDQAGGLDSGQNLSSRAAYTMDAIATERALCQAGQSHLSSLAEKAKSGPMAMLIAGLVLFLGAHSVRVWGDRLRAALVDRLGEGPFKGLYSLASIAGLVLIIYGYGTARTEPQVLWVLPLGVRHGATLILLLSMILFAAAYLPRNHFKQWLGHPMTIGAGLWAVGHLLANGTVADLVLFGAFFAWSAVLYRSLRHRDATQGVEQASGTLLFDTVAVVVGTGIWALLTFYLHAVLFGVSPFG